MFDTPIKLDLTAHNLKNNLIELKVSEIVQQNAFCSCLTTFKSNFDNDVKRIKKTNSFNPEYAYKAIWIDEWTNNQHLEIWHYNVAGDKDRKLFTLKGKIF